MKEYTVCLRLAFDADARELKKAIMALLLDVDIAILDCTVVENIRLQIATGERHTH